MIRRTHMRCGQVYGNPLASPEGWDGCPGEIDPPPGYDVYSDLGPVGYSDKEYVTVCPLCGYTAPFTTLWRMNIAWWNDDWDNRQKQITAQAEELALRKENERKQREAHQRKVLMRRGRL